MAATLVVVTPGAGRAAATPTAVQLSLQPLSENPAWTNYILDRPTDRIYPARVAVVGDASLVDNPDGLKAEGGGVTTIRGNSLPAPSLLLDMGQNTGGFVEVGITRTTGAPLHLAYSEALAGMSDTGDTTTPAFGQDVTAGGPPRSDNVIGASAQRWVSPVVRGAERWIKLQPLAPGIISIDYVRIHITHYRPGPSDYVGRFLSNDDLVNRTWFDSVYTYDMIAMRDERTQGTNFVLADGAKRDRLVWDGDLGIDALTGFYSVRAAPQMLRNSMYVFPCQSQSPDGNIPAYEQLASTCPFPDPGPPKSHPPMDLRLGEYDAWYVVNAYIYYLYTGDRALIAAMLPSIRGALDYLKSNERNGLYFATQPPTELNWHPFDVAHGSSSLTNAAYYRALVDMAVLDRDIANDPGAAAADLTHAEQVRTALMAALWDAKEGAFLVNTLDPQPNHPQDANAQAVVAGLLTDAQADSALAYIRNHLESTIGPLNGELPNDPWMSQYVSPYTSGWELWARFLRHDDTGALDLTRRLYGYMVKTDPASTMWEKVAADGTPASYIPGSVPGNNLLGNVGVSTGFTSLAHGWSTGPASALPAFVLGIRPTAPGYRDWTIEPQIGDLRWAQGQAPAPGGPLVSRWQRGDGDLTFRLTVDTSTNAAGTVAVPLLGASRTIARDGRVVWQNGRPVAGERASEGDGYVRFAGVSGRHTFAWGPVAASAANLPNTSSSGAVLGVGVSLLSLVTGVFVIGRRYRRGSVRPTSPA